MPRPHALARGDRGHGQSPRPLGAAGRTTHKGGGRGVAISPSLQSRYEPHRKSLLQAQSLPAQNRRTDRRGSASRPPNLRRNLQTLGMYKLLQIMTVLRASTLPLVDLVVSAERRSALLDARARKVTRTQPTGLLKSLTRINRHGTVTMELRQRGRKPRRTDRFRLPRRQGTGVLVRGGFRYRARPEPFAPRAQRVAVSLVGRKIELKLLVGEAFFHPKWGSVRWLDSKEGLVRMPAYQSRVRSSDQKGKE